MPKNNECSHCEKSICIEEEKPTNSHTETHFREINHNPRRLNQRRIKPTKNLISTTDSTSSASVTDNEDTSNLQQSNIVREFYESIKMYIPMTIGIYYGTLHLFIMFFSAIVLLFDTNIYHLIILLNIVFIDAISCIFLHNCPLTELEKKYLGHSIIGTRMNIFKNVGICYQCNHEYENTIEFLTNIAGLLIGKISVLIASKIFSIEFSFSFKNENIV
jgi:hypothetical protein